MSIFFCIFREKFTMNKVVGWLVVGGVGYWLFDTWGKQAIAAYNLGFRFNNVHYVGLGKTSTSFRFELLIDVMNSSIFDIYIQKFDFDILFNSEPISYISKTQNTLFAGRTITTIPILVDIDIRKTLEQLIEQIQSGYYDNWLFEIKGTLYTKNLTIPLNIEFNYQDFSKLLKL